MFLPVSLCVLVVLRAQISTAYYPNMCSSTFGTQVSVLFLPASTNQSSNMYLIVTNPLSSRATVLTAGPVWSQNYTTAISLDALSFLDAVLVDIPPQFRLSNASNERNAIMIYSAPGPATAYAITIGPHSVDAFLCLPAHALGKEYFVVTFGVSSSTGSKAVLAITAVSTGSSTSVTSISTGITITLPPNRQVFVEHDGVMYHSQGSTYSGTLSDGGDTIVANLETDFSLLLESEQDLTGTRIQSNDTLAVFSGNSGASEEEAHTSLQLPPVDYWGTRFALAAAPNYSCPQAVRVLARVNSTLVTVTLDNSSLSEEIDAGQFMDFTLGAGKMASVAASQPILVVQYGPGDDNSTAGGAGARGRFVMFVVSVNHYVADEDITFLSSDTNGYGCHANYIVLFTSKKSKGSIYIDGSPVNGTWAAIPGSDIVTTFVEVTGGHNYKVASTSDARFWTYLYGAGEDRAYAASGRFNVYRTYPHSGEFWRFQKIPSDATLNYPLAAPAVQMGARTVTECALYCIKEPVCFMAGMVEDPLLRDVGNNKFVCSLFTFESVCEGGQHVPNSTVLTRIVISL